MKNYGKFLPSSAQNLCFSLAPGSVILKARFSSRWLFQQLIVTHVQVSLNVVRAKS
jgi:hypothetical protein